MSHNGQSRLVSLPGFVSLPRDLRYRANDDSLFSYEIVILFISGTFDISKPTKHPTRGTHPALMFLSGLTVGWALKKGGFTPPATWAAIKDSPYEHFKHPRLMRCWVR